MPSDSLRVLLIDDDQAAMFLTQAILEQIPSSSFSMDWVGTAQEGLEAIRRREHDVYLVDYMLGDDSGIELVRQARSEQIREPMILLTGKGGYEIDVEAMEAGVSDYLEKSNVNPGTMERSIRYAVERVRAAAELRDSEERHRSMFDHLPIGLFRTSVSGELLDANLALVQMLGHPDRTLLQDRYAANFFVSPEDRHSFLHRLETDIVQGFESSLECRDGSRVHVRISARAHRGIDGATQYYEGAVEDVSSERRVADLHRQAARFDWLSSSSGLAILLLELDGTIRRANPAFERAFGYEGADLAGRAVTTLASDDADAQALKAEIASVAGGERDLSESQRRLSADDGDVLWARTRTGIVRDAVGKPDHLIVLFEDVAEA